MHYLEFLARLHSRLKPRTYLEIGVEAGYSLACSRCPSLGIDPDFEVVAALVAPTRLVRRTSDDYFAALADAGAGPFGPRPVDLAYIDGMHLLEYALRDFINIERYTGPAGVIGFDDMLPRTVDEASRELVAYPWTGDVFHIPDLLRRWRPELNQVMVDTEPTGTLLVTGLDRRNTVLAENLDEIVRETVAADPQPVPTRVLNREGAIDPAEALALPIWDELASRRRIS